MRSPTMRLLPRSRNWIWSLPREKSSAVRIASSVTSSIKSREPKSTGKKFDAVPMLDLRRQYQEIRSEVLAAIERVCASQSFILGPEVEALEGEVAAFAGVGDAIGCASGTDALWLALRAARGIVRYCGGIQFLSQQESKRLWRGGTGNHTRPRTSEAHAPHAQSRQP